MSHRYRGRGSGSRNYGRRGRGRGRGHHHSHYQSPFNQSHSPNRSNHSQIMTPMSSYSQPTRSYSNQGNNSMSHNLTNHNPMNTNRNRYHYQYQMDQNSSAHNTDNTPNNNAPNHTNNNNNPIMNSNNSSNLNNNSINDIAPNRYQYSYNNYYHSHTQINNAEMSTNNNMNALSNANNSNVNSLNPNEMNMNISLGNDSINNQNMSAFSDDCDSLLNTDIKTCHQIIIQRGLPTDGKLSDYELYSWFTDCHGFIGIRWGKDNTNLKYKNFAFADFETKEDANNAILRKNELCIGNNKLSLRIVNKELSITNEMRQIYYGVITQFRKRQRGKRERHNRGKRERSRSRDRDRDSSSKDAKDKSIKIKIETETELQIRKRRERIHNKLEHISSVIDKYEHKMKDKCNEMFTNDSSLAKLWKSGIEKYIESYKSVIASDKQTFCKLFECYQKQQKYENSISRLQSEIDSIDSQLFHIKNHQ